MQVLISSAESHISLSLVVLIFVSSVTSVKGAAAGCYCWRGTLPGRSKRSIHYRNYRLNTGTCARHIKAKGTKFIYLLFFNIGLQNKMKVLVLSFYSENKN